MTATAAILSSFLGVGGVAGLVAFLRLRTDQDATVVETVSRGVLVLERLNTMLEQDLAAAHAALADERAARLAAETERDELRRLHGRPTQPGEQR